MGLDLTDFCRCLPFLGPSLDVVYSDWIDDTGRNKERTAFLYDRRAVTFNGNTIRRRALARFATARTNPGHTRGSGVMPEALRSERLE